MREYDSSDWDSRPAPPPDPSLGPLPPNPKTNIRLDLEGTLLLGGEMKVEPHYKAYVVMNRSERPQPDLVAQVYRLGPETVVHPKMRLHRLRCINRLARRTILEAKVPDFRIVVCWVRVDSEGAYPGGVPFVPGVSGSAPPEDKGFKENMERTSGPRLEAGMIETAVEAEEDPEPGIARGGGGVHCEKRTPYQQESKRARQRERRQAARRAKRQSADSETEPPADDGEDRSDSPDNPDTAHDSVTHSLDNFYNFHPFVQLDRAYDKTSALLHYKNIPVGVDMARLLQAMCRNPPLDYLWCYFNYQTLNVTTAADVRGLLAIKESEILYLTRLQGKLGAIEKLQRHPGTTEYIEHRLPSIIVAAQDTHWDITWMVRVQVRRQEKREQEHPKSGASGSTVAPWLATYWEVEKAWKAKIGVRPEYWQTTG